MKRLLILLLLLLEVFVFFVDKILFVGILLALAVLFILLFVLHAFGSLWDSGAFGKFVIISSLVGLLASILPAICPVPPTPPEMQQQEEQETRGILLKSLPTPYPWVTPNPSLSPPHI
jgi:hypothetical protein